jgi:predicted alpha/beta-hydrolase family hydrolase
VRRLDLGPCAGLLHENDPDRCVVVLPGMQYSTQAPLLWFAREVAAARGWSALEVLDSLPDGAEPSGWARDRARRALDRAAEDGFGEVVVVGKSLASSAAGIVADRGLPAVWLTPLLNERRVVDDLSRAARPALLVGGSADEAWAPDALADSGLLHVVQLDGLDHSLQRPGDPRASLDALRAVAERVDRFLGELA